MARSKVRERRDIEWLVTWALVDNGLARGFHGGRLRDDWTDLGTRIDSWSIAMPSLQHEDAALIGQAIAALHPDCAALIVCHGKIGDRPDWVEEGVGRWEQARNKRGQLAWDYEQPGNRRSSRVPRLEWIGESQTSVDFYRARYDLWWIGLRELVPLLNDELQAFEATGPAAPDRPWQRDPSTVFGPDGQPLDLRTASAHRLSTQDLRRPPMPRVGTQNGHASESAVGSTHGRS